MSETKAAPQALAKPNRKLLETQFTDAEYNRRDVVVTPEAGTTLEEMLNPLFWSHVAKGLKEWDRIEVRPTDRTWWAELLVRTVQPFMVRVHVLRHAEFGRRGVGTEAAEVPGGYELRNRGRDGWAVIRTEDKVVLKEKEPSRELALAWLLASLRSVGLEAA
jgi:hypothetical protein